MRHTLPKNTNEMQHFRLNGRAYWRDVESGRIGFVISGGDDPDPPDPNAPPPADPNAPPARTFTQAELDSHAGRRAAEAKRAAETSIAEQLGVPLDKAKEIVAAAQAKDDELKTQAQRDAEAAAADRATATAEKAAAAQERLAAKVERKLAAAGLVLPEKVEDADATLARATRLLALEPDADDATIVAEIATLQAQMPGLFTPATGETPPPPPPPVPGGTGAKPPAGGQGVKSALEKGAERARQRYPQPAA